MLHPVLPGLPCTLVRAVFLDPATIFAPDFLRRDYLLTAGIVTTMDLRLISHLYHPDRDTRHVLILMPIQFVLGLGDVIRLGTFLINDHDAPGRVLVVPDPMLFLPVAFL